MTPIYRWNGEYFGFVSNMRLFNARSEYLGWVTNEGRVWRKNGTFLGEIEDENYILRRTSMASLASQATRAIPVTPAIPARRVNRVAKVSRVGKIDALDEFEST